MEIRLATLDDVEQICGLYTEFFAYIAAQQPEYYIAVREEGKYPKSVIEGEGSNIILAVENGKIVGFIQVRESATPPYGSVVSHKYAEVVDLIVTETHRRKGIGSMLMDAAKSWGRDRNLDYIELFALESAKGEIAFYKSENFTTVSQIMRFVL